MSAISVNYKGIEYPSLTALAHAFNIPESTVKDRWRRGIRTPEELIKSYRKSKQQLNITYQEKNFHTFNSLSRVCHIIPSTLRDRYNHGLRDEKLFSKPKDRKKRRTNQNFSINYKGKNYTTFTSLSIETGISKSTIRDRCNSGIRDPKLLIVGNSYKDKLDITYQGTIYHTYNSLARACGINASTLRDRHNHGLRGSALFIKPKVTKKRKPKQEISIKYQGKKYTTFSSLARKTGISKNTIRDRWNRGIHDPNLLVKTQVVSSKKKNKRSNLNKTGHTIIFREKTYNSLSEFARTNRRSPRLVQRRWNRGIRDPEKLIAPPDPKYQHKFVYVKPYEIVVRGEKYTSIASLARKYDLKPAVISKRIRDGKTGEDLIKPVRTFRKTSSIDYKGKHYQNLAEFARDNNLEYSIVYSRWKYGVHDAELLARPVKNNKLILNNISKKDAEKVVRFLHERNLISTKELAEKVNFRVESLRNYSSRRSEAIKSIGLTPQDLVRVRFTPEEIRSLHNKAILPRYAFKPSAIKHINARSQKLASKNLVIIPQTDFKYFWDADKKEVYSCRNAKDKNIFYQVKKKENGIFNLRIRLKYCLFTKSDIEDLIKNPQIEWNHLISKKQITNSLKGMKEFELIIKKALEIQHTRYDFDGHKHLGITEKELHKLLKKIKTND